MLLILNMMFAQSGCSYIRDIQEESAPHPQHDVRPKSNNGDKSVVGVECFLVVQSRFSKYVRQVESDKVSEEVWAAIQYIGPNDS